MLSPDLLLKKKMILKEDQMRQPVNAALDLTLDVLG